jgi:hypothetical protein
LGRQCSQDHNNPRASGALVLTSAQSVADPAASINKGEVDSACSQCALMLEQFETSQASFVEASAVYVEASAELEEVAYQQSGLRVEIDTQQSYLALGAEYTEKLEKY